MSTRAQTENHTPMTMYDGSPGGKGHELGQPINLSSLLGEYRRSIIASNFRLDDRPLGPTGSSPGLTLSPERSVLQALSMTILSTS
jgi:hypothetical protein